MTQRILLVYPEPYFGSRKGGIGTYLWFAVNAHLSAGREVHLLTWSTEPSKSSFESADFHPLTQKQVTIAYFDQASVVRRSAGGIYSKTISDLLVPYVLDLINSFKPDLIEGSDYKFPLHSFLERRRLGWAPQDIPVVTFNHGILRDIWPASGRLSGFAQVREFNCEEQVLAWADTVFAPSRAAFENVSPLRSQNSPAKIVPEPFQADHWHHRTEFKGDRFAYFGRLALAKGLDRCANFLSGIQREWPIMQVLFVGRDNYFPFRERDAQTFIRNRLGECLKDRVQFVDHVDRSRLHDLLKEADFFLNFSRTETFSYTTVEAIQMGLIPVVMAGTAMAELLPEHLKDKMTLEGPPFRFSDAAHKLRACVENFRTWLPEIQNHVRSLTDTASYAAKYSDVVATSRRSQTRRNRYSSLDISVLIPSCNDARYLTDGLLSIFKQTEPVLEVLILDDGTSAAEDRECLRRIATYPPVRIIETANRGLVEARRRLLTEGRGSLVMFLDADDYLDATFVRDTLSALNLDRQYSAALSRRRNFGKNEHEYTSFLLGTKWHWVLNDYRMTALIERRVFEKIQFDREMLNGEADDWWWWLRFSLHGFKAIMVPEALFHYHFKKGSMSYPWSEGQAAMTVSAMQSLVVEASALGVDLTEPLQVAWGQQYKAINVKRRH